LKKLLVTLAGLLMVAAGLHAQTTTYTGVIKDLALNPVTSGQVTFTLAPSTDSTLSGTGRFTPSTITCKINGDGTLSASTAGVVSACKVVSNTSINPTGTSYRICIQPNFATPGSCFFDYATGGSKDISTVAPTLATGPVNYSGIPGPPLQFLGAWSSTVTYNKGQIASYNNVVYVSLVQPNLNQTPASSPASWSPIYTPPVQGLINVSTYPGVDICAKINAAALANPGIILDARQFSGNQPCASNPFNSTTHDMVVLFNNVTIQTTAPWVTQSDADALILGSGRGGDTRGTNIQAVAGFPATCDGLSIGCPILRLGSGFPAFGHRIENMTLDCNGLAGCIGLYSTDINEQSGAIHFMVENYSNIGVLIDGSGANSAGPFFSQNYSLEDGEVYANDFAISTTIGVELIGGNSGASGATAPRVVNNITSSGSVAHPLATSYILDSFWGGALTNLNAEKSLNGYQFSNTGPVVGTMASNIRCASVVNICVWSKAVGTISNNLTLIGVQNTPTVASATIQDDIDSDIITDATVGLYVTGQGLPGGGQTLLTTARGRSSLLFGLNLINNSDTPQSLNMGSGATAAQGQILNFVDRGTSKWIFQNTNLNEFQIRDQAHNLTRIYFNLAGQASFNSAADQGVFFNLQPNSGTGGTSFCSGGPTPTCTTHIDANGVLTTPIYSPVVGTSAPTGACTVVGQLIITADGHGTSCSAASVWTSRW
jgi:hypothetical protein